MGDNSSTFGVKNGPEKSTVTLFAEDTVQITLHGGPPIVGVIAKTWHDLEDVDIWDEIGATIRGEKVTVSDFREFKKTGLPPRDFYYFIPSAPENAPVLVHASECTLLDRALAFGDTVKRSLTNPQSGTVISVETQVNLRQSFYDPSNPLTTVEATNVPESELEFVSNWGAGDFIIYKNCWMGIVQEHIRDEVTIKLENGSVVVLANAFDLEIPLDVPPQSSSTNVAQRSATPTSRTPLNHTVPPTVLAPSQLSPGLTIKTNKANLLKGRWIYGAYNPSVPPIGVIMDVKTEAFEVNWLGQNIMTEKFVPVDRPSPEIILEEEEHNIIRFKKSTSGFKDIYGNPFTQVNQLGGGGDLQVGDKVRFTDIDAAVVKYNGAVRKIPRKEALGFDINTFTVVATDTKVRVLWQDMTESLESARSLVPYLNVDEHDVWPGEIVIIKAEPSDESGGKAGGVGTIANSNPGAVDGDSIRPKKVGIVQSIDPSERIASVRWFESPDVELTQTTLIPGSKTGPLEPISEDISLYDVVAHQALGIRRGDFVLITPDFLPSEQGGTDQDTVRSAAESNSSLQNSTTETRTTFTSMSEVIGVLARALQAHENSDYQHLGQGLEMAINCSDVQSLTRLLERIGHITTTSNPGLLHYMSSSLARDASSVDALVRSSPWSLRPANGPAPNAADIFANLPTDWVGEVVDLGLDGLITVRLGALKEPKDLKVAPERLFVIFNDSMELGDEELESYGSDDEDYSTDSEDDFEWMNDPEVLEEKIIYEGGERLDNGGEEDWLTDDDEMDSEGGDEDDEDDEDKMDVPMTDAESLGGDATMSMNTPLDNGLNEDHTSASEPVPRTPPPIPDNVPGPEAISFAPGAPSRFRVLDSPIPDDHHYKNQQSTTRSPAVARRIHKEHKILASSLPDGIFVRTWESRLDLLRVLIVGPRNTPYELAPFVFDFYLSDTFPAQPPLGYFHSWTGGVGRVNPNLYQDGKICLSLLGTWHAQKRAEGWSAGGSSILQLLVSLMGLVLVREPWYNEAGYNIYEGSEQVALNSQLYSERAYILARGFVKHVLQTPVQGFESVIEWLYLPPGCGTVKHEEDGEELGPGSSLLNEVVMSAKEVVRRSEGSTVLTAEETTNGIGKVSKGALALLKRHLSVLEAILEEKTKIVA
ncbi:hypothetical protein BZA77DRAFT_289264 [Pyronema omphalodes]|nr:hypothetical protein BZA77DRAFT_289264 [Pyronema omphalodes]